MNAQNAKDYLPLVQALADGKTIQQYTTNNQTLHMEWRDDLSPTWVADAKFYRIKPEPRRWWIVEALLSVPYVYYSKEAAERARPGCTPIEVVEVIK